MSILVHEYVRLFDSTNCLIDAAQVAKSPTCVQEIVNALGSTTICPFST